MVFIIAVYESRNSRSRYFLDISLLFLFSILLEYLGVKSQKIFGAYSYKDSVLGWQILGIPLLIGINWVSLILSSSAFVYFIKPFRQWNVLFRALLSALFMTFMDFLLEPVAIFFHFWTWNSGKIVPMQNYLAWFLFSFLFQWFFQFRNTIKENIVLMVLYISQGIFFLALNMAIYFSLV